VGPRVPGARCRGRALAFALLAAALVPVGAASQTLSDLTGLLQPGSRPSLALGGDPFRSALDDQYGWWPELGLSREPEVGVEGVWSEPLHSEVANLQRVLTGRWVVDAPGVGSRLRLGGEIVAPNWGIRWAGGDGAVRLGGSGVGGIVGARVRELLPGLTVQGVSPSFGALQDVRGPAAGGGVRYRFRRLAVLQASWDRSRSPELLRSDLYGESIEASLNLGSERTRVDAALSLPGRLRLEGSAARSDFQDLKGREIAPVYHLAPRGRSTLAQGSVAWDSPVGWRVLGRYTHRDLDVRGTAAWGGQRFAELSSARVEQESYLVGAEHGSPGGPRWLLDAEMARTDARARLELETWPFTPSTIDLLGLRRIYRTIGEARWHRIHLAFDYPIRRSAHVGLGLAGYDIAPRGSLESWRPVFLVFGATDGQTERLDTRRLQLAALSLGIGMSVGTSQVELAAQQFVFAKAFPIPKPSVNTGASQPSGSVSASRGALSGWSGIEVRASISRRFGGRASR
jgi:hypothetical protein